MIDVVYFYVELLTDRLCPSSCILSLPIFLLSIPFILALYIFVSEISATDVYYRFYI